MSLRIRFINKTNYEAGLALGEIALDDFVENFETPLTYWDADRYEKQWRQGLDRLLAGASRSCLITSMLSPNYEVFGVWWKLYREGPQIVVQNQLLLSDVLAREFDPEDPYKSIPDRVSLSEDGTPVSEWLFAFNQIEPFGRNKGQYT
jgi:hypothetical protein